MIACTESRLSRKRWFLALFVLCFSLNHGTVDAVEIPAFTPNVVDPGRRLDAAATQRVNAELQKIRDESKIWGAVYIVESLGGQPIEEIAEKAFKKWQLGEAGVDNGLLLVLAMRDRKSRFEVGYGLEGSITDAHARRALDNYLAPKMRTGDTAGAVIDSFAYLSNIASAGSREGMPETALSGEILPDVPITESPHASDPHFLADTDPQAIDASGGGAYEPPEADIPPRAVFLAIVVFLVFSLAIWAALWPLQDRYKEFLLARLKRLDPELQLGGIDIESDGPNGSAKPLDGVHEFTFPAFLASFPGVLALLVFSEYPGAFFGFVAAALPFMLLLTWVTTRRYASPARYRQQQAFVAAQREELMKKGYLEQKAPGVYSYTAAYRASRASSSSSSRSSRSRSSSGGGRSGGGGASSGW